MDCRHTQAMIMPYIRNELSNSDLEAFLEHIDGCALCKEELEIYYIIEMGLNTPEEAAGSDIQKALSEQIKESHMLVSSLRLAKILYYALNTLLFIGTALAVLLQIRIWWQGGYL